MDNGNDKNKFIKLCNPVMLPWWKMQITTWLLIIPINFVADSAIFIITLKILKYSLSEMIKIYKKTIIKILIFGFIADFIGIISICLIIFIGIIIHFFFDPDFSVNLIVIKIIGILVSAICIFLFNIKIALKKTNLSNKNKKIIALSLAIFTAPYIYLVPHFFI